MSGVPRRIWLVGLSGAGKSTIGPLLARRLGYRYVDLDREVEELAGAGFTVLAQWLDGAGDFSLTLAQRANGSRP